MSTRECVYFKYWGPSAKSKWCGTHQKKVAMDRVSCNPAWDEETSRIPGESMPDKPLVHLNAGSDFPNLCGTERHPRDTAYLADVTCPDCNRIKQREVDRSEFIAELIDNPDFWYHVLESDFLADHGLPDFPVKSNSVRNSGEIDLPVSLPPWDYPANPSQKPQGPVSEPPVNPVGPSTLEIITGLSAALNRVSSALAPNVPVSDIAKGLVMCHTWLDQLTVKALKNEL